MNTPTPAWKIAFAHMNTTRKIDRLTVFRVWLRGYIGYRVDQTTDGTVIVSPGRVSLGWSGPERYRSLQDAIDHYVHAMPDHTRNKLTA